MEKKSFKLKVSNNRKHICHNRQKETKKERKKKLRQYYLAIDSVSSNESVRISNFSLNEIGVSQFDFFVVIVFVWNILIFPGCSVGFSDVDLKHAYVQCTDQ